MKKAFSPRLSGLSASMPSFGSTPSSASAPASFPDLLGPTLVNRSGTVLDTATALAGKSTVGLYFSAHWCPPCTTFTPRLVSAYEGSLAAKGLEIVFVSSDKDAEAFDHYRKNFPLALPYANRELKDELSRRFKVTGIPTLVLLDERCNIITRDARQALVNDPTGEKFPWRQTPVSETLLKMGSRLNEAVVMSARSAGAAVQGAAEQVRRTDVGGRVSEGAGAFKSTVAKAGRAVGDAVNGATTGPGVLGGGMRPSAPKTTPMRVVVFGVGGVGRELVKGILDARASHERDYGIAFCFKCLVDSSAAADVSTSTDAVLTDVLAHKANGQRLSALPPSMDIGLRERSQGESNNEFLVGVVRHHLRAGRADRLLVVDCTATDDTAPALVEAVKAGAKVACANKKPFTGPQDVYDTLVGSHPRLLGRVRYESSVGAGLPVIAALTRTMTAADPVRKITGTFSGTLGYVMTGLQEGQPFSEVVRKAKELGYTEPDPRDDLGGVDVARKALILARGMGWRLEMGDVEVEALYPDEMAALSVTDFMAKLPELDASFVDKIKAAKDKGCVLRYAAHIEDGKLKVSLAEVGAESPLGRLSGTDNLVEFYTKWYDPNPLVVQGAGAGTGTTAAGVLSDMVELCFT